MEMFGGLLMGLFASGIAGLVIWVANEDNKRALGKKEERQKESVQWLRKEREAARLRQDIAAIKEQDELRPLVLETKKAILQGKADKRLLDAVFARRALDDVLGMGPPPRDEDPMEAAAAKILEEIESRRADGKDTSDLEALLRGLRGLGGE